MSLADRALVVGINRYPSLSNLSGAEADASDFHAWVTAQGGVAPTDATLILSSSFVAAVDPSHQEPLRERVYAFFENVRAAAITNSQSELGFKAGKRLYLFFAGHGFAPTLDSSGVLMANANEDFLYNVSPILWANRMYNGGWFDEVLLFQDACRSPITGAQVDIPTLREWKADGTDARMRFYAFAAKSPQSAIEKTDGNGQVHGVFSTTLLAGLRGDARDPATGDITAAGLKEYLQANMVKKLSPAEFADSEVAKNPEVFHDGFVIVGGRPSDVPKFPVFIQLPAAGQPASVVDGNFKVVRHDAAAPTPWVIDLPIGIFSAQSNGKEELFKVTGGRGPDGNPVTVNVSFH
ncbi:MAG: hypothetical protein EPO08_02460 [Rhodospirillaceae bacterium]|nr:MAG: hypothetical protein EPO08_02460 [Rhodospirillaceae bacterium]